MQNKTLLLVILVIGILINTNQMKAQTQNLSQPAEKSQNLTNDKLVILWTSGDREVALKMVFMYTLNSKRHEWWDDVTLIVWGPSAGILSKDKELQSEIKKIVDAGIVVKACKGCSDMYGVSEKLEEIGVTVLYIGGELTDYIREGRHILTF